MKIAELAQSLLCPSLRTRSAVHWLPSLTVCCPAFFPYGGCSESSTGLLGAYTQDTLGKFPASHVYVESSPGQNIRAAFQFFDFVEITEARVPVSSPGKFYFLQCLRQGRKLERLLRLVRPTLACIIDYGRCRSDEHQMVGFRLAGYFREVVVT